MHQVNVAHVLHVCFRKEGGQLNLIIYLRNYPLLLRLICFHLFVVSAEEAPHNQLNQFEFHLKELN